MRRCLRCGAELFVSPEGWVDAQGSLVCVDYTGHDEHGPFAPMHAESGPTPDSHFDVHRDDEMCEMCEEWRQSQADDELAEAGVL